jgi:hypothetical protein
MTGQMVNTQRDKPKVTTPNNARKMHTLVTVFASELTEEPF